MRARKLSFSAEIGKSSICLHLALADPARRKQLAITADGVARVDQEINRFGDLINMRNLMSILR